MSRPLWDHQRQAIDFALSRSATMFHMGLGTGKSRCAIEVAKRIGAKRVLILCPLSVCDAWLDQLAQFGSGLHPIILGRGSVKRKTDVAKSASKKAESIGRSYVCVVNYESARNKPLAGWLAAQSFDLLVLDESHRIKAHDGETSRWVARLSKTCSKRLALTGTPMPHSPLDIFAQARSLEPGLFGASYYRFRNRYAVMGGYLGKEVKDYKNKIELREKISRITYQADRSVLDLPEAIHATRYVDLSPKAARMYADLDRDFVAAVQEGEVTAANALVKLLRLQQLTSGRVKVESMRHGPMTVQVDNSKQKALEDILQDLPADEPVVVFGRFRGDISATHMAAKKTGRRSLELSGQRKELSRWQRGEAPVLAVQIQSGGTGIDLTRAAYCVYLSTGFSLGDFEQSLARVHRPGQKRTVFYYYIVANNTVDLKVSRALRDRKKVVESVLADIKLLTKEIKL